MSKSTEKRPSSDAEPSTPQPKTSSASNSTTSVSEDAAYAKSATLTALDARADHLREKLRMLESVERDLRHAQSTHERAFDAGMKRVRELRALGARHIAVQDGNIIATWPDEAPQPAPTEPQPAEHPMPEGDDMLLASS